MRRTPTHLLVSLLALLAASALAGCGGGSTSTTGPTATGPTTSAQKQGGTTAPAGGGGGNAGHAAAGSKQGNDSGGSGSSGKSASEFTPKHHHDSGGGSKQFIVKGGDNSVQNYGAEASRSEFERAAAALHGFLDARAERNWAAACTYLAKSARQGLAQLGHGGGCAAILGALSDKVPTSTLREAAVADVGALRAHGGRGFLIYRGAPHGTVYAISIVSEGGAWKVASLSGVPLG